VSHSVQMQSLAAYNRWADDRILTTADPLSDDALNADCADGRPILGALLHALGTQLWWLGNWTGIQPPVYEQTRAGLRQAYTDAHDRIDTLVAATDGARWAAALEFSFPGAPVIKLPMWQTFAQVMLHGVQHRSQLAEALTRLGHSPGDMEYIIWLKPEWR
jgi:uncharacterized damage-inducible protein DinB